MAFPVGSVNDTQICFDVEIIDDDYAENTQEFYVSIKVIDVHAWVLGSTVVRVVIYDDDGKLDINSR